METMMPFTFDVLGLLVAAFSLIAGCSLYVERLGRVRAAQALDARRDFARRALRRRAAAARMVC
jgi:hypothetical protein